jgi:HK97 family phage major capsid protein
MAVEMSREELFAFVAEAKKEQENPDKIKMTRAQLKELLLKGRGITSEQLKDETKDAVRQQNWAMRQQLAGEQAYEEKNKGEAVDPLFGLALALAAGRGHLGDAHYYAQRRWGEKSKVTKALSVAVPTGAGMLVPETLAPEVVELLVAQTVMRKSGATIIPLVNGQLTMTRQTGGATAAYLSEGGNIGYSQLAVDQFTLQGHKLGALTAISTDLLDFQQAGVNVEQMVRRDIVTQMALREDLAFLEGNGALATPVGLRNQMTAANAIAMTATPTAVTATTDAARMENVLDNANIPNTKRGWIMRPAQKNWLSQVREATGALAFPSVQANGTWWGHPIATTTQITMDAPTTNYIYLAEFPELMIGDAMTMRIDASTEAAYDVSGTMVSPFSRDEAVIRAICMHDFNMRHTGSACALTGVTWGNV